MNELREFFAEYLEHHPDADPDEEWCMKHLPTPAEFRAAIAEPEPDCTCGDIRFERLHYRSDCER